MSPGRIIGGFAIILLALWIVLVTLTALIGAVRAEVATCDTTPHPGVLPKEVLLATTLVEIDGIYYRACDVRCSIALLIRGARG